MNGYINNYHELQLLINDTNPDVICLQETHVNANLTNIAYPKQFIGYFYNFSSNTYAKQGVSILVRKDIPHKPIPINSNTCSLGIEILAHPKICIFNTYIPPSHLVAANEILKIIDLSSKPILYVGDFNAWSPLWGSSSHNSRGFQIEEVINKSTLTLLNDGSATYHSTHNSFTAIDLTLVSASLFPFCKWSVNDSLYGNDHYPLKTKVQFRTNPINIPPFSKFKIDKANWDLYRAKCKDNFNFPATYDLNLFAAKIIKGIKVSANFAIPQTKPSLNPRNVPWWSKTLQDLRQQKQSLWHAYKQTRSTALISYRKSNALFKYNSKKAKREFFERFTSNITPLSSTKKTWSDLNRLIGNFPNNLRTIKYNNEDLHHSADICDAFGNFWSDYSKDDNFSHQYKTRKEEILSQKYTPTKLSTASTDLDSNFTLSELEYALQYAKGKTPGIDRISYPMLKQLPSDAKYRLLEMYNAILARGT